MRASPASSCSRPVSLITTSRPAFAHAMAMPPPIVPAPTIATVLIGGTGRVLRDAWDLRGAALGEKHVNERLALLGLRAIGEDPALADAAFVEGQRGGGLDGVDHGARRLEIAACLLCQFAPRGQERREGVEQSAACRARSRVSRMRATAVGGTPRELHGAADEIAIDDPIDQPEAERFGSLDRLAGDAHLDRLFDADQARQPLRALGAGDDAEVHLRLAHLRVGDRNAVVTGHGQFEAAAERGAVQRHDHRLRAVLEAGEDVVHVGRAAARAPGQLFQPLDVGAGDERPSGSGDDDPAHRRVCLGLRDGGIDAVRHLLAERVYRRVVDA